MKFYSYLKNRKEREKYFRIIFFRRVCGKIRKRGYYVSPNYGLIMERECDGYILADIRFSEKKVVLPIIPDLNDQKNKKLSDYEKEKLIEKRDKLSKLRKILIKEKIFQRERHF
jgi:hypothetical protein